MAHPRKSRTAKPIIFVFCEGKTEEEYIKILRAHFRIPIQIVTKQLGTKISQRILTDFVKEKGYSDKDLVYLFYDGDRMDILHKLESLKCTGLLISIPCVELWFMLHFYNYAKEQDSKSLMKEWLKLMPDYNKGRISANLKETLIANWKIASERAKLLEKRGNPSSQVYILLDYLETVKNR